MIPAWGAALKAGTRPASSRGRARQPAPDFRQEERPALAAVLQPRLDRLVDVHLVEDVVPRRALGQLLDEAAGLLLDRSWFRHRLSPGVGPTGWRLVPRCPVPAVGTVPAE